MNGKWSYVIGALLLIPTLFGGCRPKHASPARVSDGTVVLLRKGVTNAAFVVTKQSASPEVVNYTWYLRWDGKTTFESNNPATLTGSVKGAKTIAFGPFDINWSTAGSEGGWLYYPGEPRSVRMPWGNAVGELLHIQASGWDRYGCHDRARHHKSRRKGSMPGV